MPIKARFAALLLMAAPSLIIGDMVQAQSNRAANRDTVYEFEGKSFRSLRECIKAKQRAKRRGTVTGAVVGGAVAAAAGGNAGTTAAVAGAGAAIGRAAGRSSRPQQC